VSDSLLCDPQIAPLSKTAVGIWADQQEERGEHSRQVWLIRVQQQNPNDQTTIRMLYEKMGFPLKRVINVNIENRREREVRSLCEGCVGADCERCRGRGYTRSYEPRYQQAVLSEPFGPFYTKLSVPCLLTNTPEVRDWWDRSPIETVEIAMIPPKIKPDKIRSGRLKQRCVDLTLHFADPQTPFFEVVSLVEQMQLYDLSSLEIRNVNANSQQVKTMFRHLPLQQYPYLKKIKCGPQPTQR
jgi:hypothetical protein